MPAVEPIPAAYPRVTPYLCCRGAAAAIDFYVRVLDAKERMRMPGDSPETIGHAELEIGTGMVMLADEFPDHGFLSPKSVGGTPVTIHVYVADVDATYAKALDAGATSVREVENQFYGDRSGQFEDPFGHRWSIASHVEDVSEEEMGRRMAEMAQG
jgi:PhnB protein